MIGLKIILIGGIMQVSSISMGKKVQSFGKLEFGYSVLQSLSAKSVPVGFKKQLGEVVNIIKDNKFNKKRYVDIILESERGHKDGEYSFYGVISSKKTGVPMHPFYRIKIDTTPDVVKQFKLWLETWDNMYSPEFLKKYKMVLKEICKKK